jgi:hypothetical protein
MTDAVTTRRNELRLRHRIEARTVLASRARSVTSAVTDSGRGGLRVTGVTAECRAGIGAVRVSLRGRLGGSRGVPRAFRRPPRSYWSNERLEAATVGTADGIDRAALWTASAGASAHGMWRRLSAAAGGRPIGTGAHEPLGGSAPDRRCGMVVTGDRRCATPPEARGARWPTNPTSRRATGRRYANCRGPRDGTATKRAADGRTTGGEAIEARSGGGTAKQ